MSAAIQLVNQPLVNTDTLVERPINNVSRFESAAEQRLRRALEQINELQAEVRTLRDELARTERFSANYELLRSGMIYPLYYMTLAGKLRRKLDAAVQEAQATAKTLGDKVQTLPTNIWQLDRSTSGVTLATLKAITDDNVVYPDLFRRILRHYQIVQMNAYWTALRSGAANVTPPTGFELGKLFDGANPYVFVISDQDFVRLADVFEINGDSLRMKKSPADLVFLS